MASKYGDHYDPVKAMKATVDRRREMGLCYKCGKPLEDNHKTCVECRKKTQEYMHAYKQAHPEKFDYKYGKPISAAESVMIEKPKKRKKKQQHTMGEILKIARERGVSYGTIVAEIETMGLAQQV